MNSYMSTYNLKRYGVLYYENNSKYTANSPLIFLCEAEDTEHAEEQVMNAYPGCTVVWTTVTDSNRELEQIEQTYDDYYSEEHYA